MPIRLAPICLVLGLSPSITNAGIEWSGETRLLAGGFASGWEGDTMQGSGTADLGIEYMRQSPRGASVIKGLHVSVIEGSTYKSNTAHNYRSTHPTPGLKLGKCLMNLYSSFTLSETTALLINHTIDGEFIDQDTFHLEITSADDQSLHFELSGRPLTKRSTVYLQAGTYHFEENTQLFGFERSEPQHRRFATHVSVSVVPAPATLATLIPLGIAAIRRRR